MKSILISILISCIIATGISYGLINIFNFWNSFVLCIVSQFVISYVYKSIKIGNNSATIRAIQQQTEEIVDDIYQRSVAEIKCPCGKHSEIMTILINDDNEYTCPECNNSFVVIATLLPNLITDPISSDKVLEDLQEKRTRINEAFLANS